MTHNDHVLRWPDPPVAVLTGQTTASAGEAVLAAFLGPPSLRTFGEKTAGLATGNTRWSRPRWSGCASNLERTGVAHRSRTRWATPPCGAVLIRLTRS